MNIDKNLGNCLIKLKSTKINILFHKNSLPLFTGILTSSNLDDNIYIVNAYNSEGFSFNISQVVDIIDNNIICKFTLKTV